MSFRVSCFDQVAIFSHGLYLECTNELSRICTQNTFILGFGAVSELSSTRLTWQLQLASMDRFDLIWHMLTQNNNISRTELSGANAGQGALNALVVSH